MVGINVLFGDKGTFRALRAHVTATQAQDNYITIIMIYDIIKMVLFIQQ